jgi:hypothetical protein
MDRADGGTERLLDTPITLEELVHVALEGILDPDRRRQREQHPLEARGGELLEQARVVRRQSAGVLRFLEQGVVGEALPDVLA